MGKLGTSSKPPKPPTAAERWYRLGSQLAQAGRFREALEPLEQALSYSVEEPGAAFLRALRSWYGVCISHVHGDIKRGRRLCEEAILQGNFEPQLYANLARVYIRAQRKDLASETLLTAQRMAPFHRETQDLCRQLGVRRTPVFPFLERSHPLNRFVGKLRHRLVRGVAAG